MSDQQIWEQTLSLLERHGWAKGTFSALDKRPGMCVLGALGQILTGNCHQFSGDYKPSAAERRLLRGLLTAAGWPVPASSNLHQQVMRWNDDPDRTDSDVFDVLRKLAQP